MISTTETRPLSANEEVRVINDERTRRRGIDPDSRVGRFLSFRISSDQLEKGTLLGLVGRVLRQHDVFRTQYDTAERRATVSSDGHVLTEMTAGSVGATADLQGIVGDLEALARASSDIGGGAYVDTSDGDTQSLLLSIDHIALDRLSIAHLAKDIGDATTGRRLVERVDFADNVRAQRRMRYSPEYASDVARYLRSADISDSLTLLQRLGLAHRLDREVPARTSFFELDPIISAAVYAAARSQHVPISATLAGALADALSELTRVRDIPLLVMLPGRRRVEEIFAVGWFANRLPVRIEAVSPVAEISNTLAQAVSSRALFRDVFPPNSVYWESTNEPLIRFSVFHESDQVAPAGLAKIEPLRGGGETTGYVGFAFGHVSITQQVSLSTDLGDSEQARGDLLKRWESALRRRIGSVL